MRAVFVHPAGLNWVPGKKDITATANRMAPLGLLSMSSFLKRKERQVSIHDYLGPNASAEFSKNVQEVLSQKPELICFSTTTSCFLSGHDMAVSIKQSDQRIKTVFGEVRVSALGASLLKDYTSIDYLCRGDGKDTSAIDGLIWRDGERVVTNPPRQQLADLDQLPFPDYESLPGFSRGYGRIFQPIRRHRFSSAPFLNIRHDT